MVAEKKGADFQGTLFEQSLVSESKIHTHSAQKVKAVGGGMIFLDNSHSNVKFPSSNIVHISLFRHLPREKKNRNEPCQSVNRGRDFFHLKTKHISSTQFTFFLWVF